jgi:predicted phage-related endonuclease
MNIKATIVPVQPGTPEWAQHRARSLNASDLAAAMGLSPYLSRADLIKRIATGIVPEVDAATQRRFDKGHEVEALARPLAEEIIGEELYAGVFSANVDGLDRPVSASLDGHPLEGDPTWEHKQANADLIASLHAGVIPEQYHPQMEQGQMLTGATRTLFTASNGTRESAVHVWYESRPELRAKIIPTWKQLMADVAAYVPTEAEVKPVGKSPDQLPALRSSVSGQLVLESNIKEWEAAALVYIKAVRDHELKTDQDFEDADAAAKWCASSKTTLDGLKSNLMAATGDVNTAVGTIDRIMSELDKTRIQFTKAIDARKTERKAEIVAGGVAALAQYVRELNAAMPANYMPSIPADFGGCIKGLRTFASIQNAVDTELARAKIAAGEVANRIHTNVGQINAANAPTLFPDMAPLVLKAPDDLAAIISQRLAAEQARREAETARIRAEEAARLEREAEAERKVREAAEEMARQREQEESDRVERERAHAVQVEVDRKARELQEAASAQRIRDEQTAPTATARAAERVGALIAGNVIQPTESLRQYGEREEVTDPTDDGARLTLGQINDILSPVSISVAGLSTLGFEPAAQVKASRLYRACDLPAICQAISAHVLAACEVVA